MKNLALILFAGVALTACAQAQKLAGQAETAAAKAEASAEKAEASADKAEADAAKAEAAAKTVAATDDPVEANKKLVDGAVLIDANSAEEHKAKSHPTAINVPAADVNAAVAAIEKDHTDKAKTYVIFSTDGKTAVALRDALKAKGYTDVRAVLQDAVVVPEARVKANAAVKKVK
jgi:rhodanese-related sulfurtransferase